MQTPSCCWPSWLSTVFGAKGRSAAALLPAPSPALRPLLIEPSACSIDLDPTTRALSECGGFGRLVSTARNYSLSDALESLDDGNDLALLAGAGANAVDSAGRAPQESAAAVAMAAAAELWATGAAMAAAEVVPPVTGVPRSCRWRRRGRGPGVSGRFGWSRRFQ